MIGVDDGRFARSDVQAPLAAVALVTPQDVEAIAVGSVRVDGTDATDRVLALLKALGHAEDRRALLLDGVVLGGFNVLDLDRLHRATGLPVVSVTRRPPDLPRIRAALRQWFPRDARRRYALLRAHRLFPVATGGRPILAAVVGARRGDAVRLVQRTAVRGFWPEPIRLAHLIASAAGARGRGFKARRRRADPGPVA